VESWNSLRAVSPVKRRPGAGAVEGEGTIALSGSFAIGEAVALSSVDTEDATVTKVPAPASTSAPSITGTSQAGETLTANSGGWSGAQPISYAYHWQRCSSSGGECAGIAEATAPSYTLISQDIGSTIRVLVTASDSDGSGLASSSTTATVGAPPSPANTVAPSISGDAEEGATINANAGEWSALEPVAYAYEWESCNTSGGECAPIEGASDADYTPDEGDIGATLRVRVTATNAGGTAQAISPATPVVEAMHLSEQEGPSISGTPDEGATLHANPGRWSGNETHFSYQWESCNTSGGECAPIEGAITQQYELGEGDVATTLRVRVGVHSARDALSDLSQPTPVIGHSETLASTQQPTISGAPQEGQTLVADPGSWTSAAGPTSYAYQWQHCDSSASACQDIAGAISHAYTSRAEDTGNRLRVLVTASDETQSASRSSEATQPIAASQAPLVQKPPEISGGTLVGETLTASTGVITGIEGASYAVQWERCDASGACQTIDGATGSTYTLTEDDVGSTMAVLVTASNTDASTVAITPQTAIESQSHGTLVAEPGIWIDHENYIKAYAKEIAKFARRGTAPGVWGLHDYHDIVHKTDRAAEAFANTVDTQQLHYPHVWISEAGVELQAGTAATDLVKGKTNDERRKLQREAAFAFLHLYNARRDEIERVYYYSYRQPSVEKREATDMLLTVASSKRK
jgi:hypothetical protein